MPADLFRRSPLALAILGILEAGPLHPYGIQRRIKEWGKDAVVNVGQRSSLYKTITRLEAAGLIVSDGTDRDPNYPERTSYRITETGRASAREWLADIIATPRNEFPEFPAALSFAPMISPETLRELLTVRSELLTNRITELDSDLRTRFAGHALPRVTLLDTEHQRAVVAAELAWTTAVISDIDTGALSWTVEQLRDFADRHGG